MQTVYKTGFRLLLLLVFVLGSFTSLRAQQLKGLQFESRRMVTINIDGQDINRPSQSCFVANLNRGRYHVKVYSSRRCVYDEHIYYPGHGVKSIQIRDGNNPGHDFDDDDFDDDFDNDACDNNHNASNRHVFKQLLARLDDTPFDDDKLDYVKVANFKNVFSAKEIILLVKEFTFGDNKLEAAKLLYRSCYEKQLYFTVAESLTFLSEKEELLDYIKCSK